MMILRVVTPALLLLSLGGCGSSGGGADGGAKSTGSAGSGGNVGGAGHNAGGAGHGGSGGAAVNPELYWKADGVVESAQFVEATRMTSATNDTVEIIGAAATLGGGISISVSTNGTLGGTYTCPFDGGSVVELTYHLMAPTVESCSVTIGFTTDAGGHEHVTGTFEATLTFQDAGMTMLTDGVIDIPDMRMGG